MAMLGDVMALNAGGSSSPGLGQADSFWRVPFSVI